MEIPDEKIVIAAKVTAFNPRVFSSSAVPDIRERGGRRADPIEVRRHDAVLRAGRHHPDHFPRAQIRREECEVIQTGT